jgi:hypothetical protein
MTRSEVLIVGAGPTGLVPRALVDQARRLDQDAGKQVGQILTGQRFYFDKISFIQPVPRANGRKNLCRNRRLNVFFCATDCGSGGRPDISWSS